MCSIVRRRNVTILPGYGRRDDARAATLFVRAEECTTRVHSLEIIILFIILRPENYFCCYLVRDRGRRLMPQVI